MPKTSLAFVTNRARTNGMMEKEQQEATVHWKKLNIIIRRGTLFNCGYKEVVENREHKLIVTQAIELKPIFKYETKIWTCLRLFKFTNFLLATPFFT